jgi:hypothetical protein
MPLPTPNGRSMGLDTQLLLRAHGDPEKYERQPDHTPGLQYLARSPLGYTDDSIFYNASNDAAITLHLIIWTLRCDILLERLQFFKKKKHLELVRNDVILCDYVLFGTIKLNYYICSFLSMAILVLMTIATAVLVFRSYIRIGSSGA